MKPIYAQDGVEFYHGDSALMLPLLPNADLIVTSPPYGGIRDYGGHGWDFNRMLAPICNALSEGAILCWHVGEQVIGGSYSCDAMRQGIAFTEAGLRMHDRLIIDTNRQGAMAAQRYYQTWDFCWILSKGKPRTFNPIEDIPNRSADRKPQPRTDGGRDTLGLKYDRNGSRYQPHRYRKRSAVWWYQQGVGHEAFPVDAGIHPARMHMDIALDLIRSYSNPGDLVIDPFSGSGTTARAAQILGRRAIGIEIHKPYIDAGIQGRFAQQILV